MQHIKTSRPLLAGFIAASLLALAACQCDQSKLSNKTWVLEKYGTEPDLQAVIIGNPPAQPEITLKLDGQGHFSGNDGCNLLGGVYTLGGNCMIRFDSIHSTLMFCADSLIRVQAGAIDELIREVNAYEVSDNALKLCAPGKRVLEYRKK